MIDSVLIPPGSIEGWRRNGADTARRRIGTGRGSCGLKAVTMGYRYSMQVASDVSRDGLGVELLSESGDVVAEVFRSDRDRTVILSTFSYDIPLGAIESLLIRAREHLDPFEDGVPLSEAVLVGPGHVRADKADSGR
jgi:hypothetical protein